MALKKGSARRAEAVCPAGIAARRLMSGQDRLALPIWLCCRKQRVFWPQLSASGFLPDRQTEETAEGRHPAGAPTLQAHVHNVPPCGAVVTSAHVVLEGVLQEGRQRQRRVVLRGPCGAPPYGKVGTCHQGRRSVLCTLADFGHSRKSKKRSIAAVTPSMPIEASRQRPLGWPASKGAFQRCKGRACARACRSPRE